MSPANPFNRFDFPRNLDNERLYASWFPLADTDHDGRISGENAVKFLDRSGLDRQVLAKIWALADSSRAGFLDQSGFFRAMDLVAVAQQTGDVSAEAYTRLASRGGLKPPKMGGLDGVAAEDSPPTTSNPFHERSVSNLHVVPPSPGYHTPSSGAPSPGMSSPGVPTPGPKFKNMSANKRIMTLRECSSIVDGLKVIYFNKIKILEELYKFGSFFSSYLTEADFQAKPSVLLLGQYSTGKTTFIKHLLGRDYPGINIGPEPTTDRFVVVMGGVEERRTPGNTLIVQPDKPYSGLSEYGNGFLAKFEGASCPSKLLEEITLVDTPGVLSGEKQRIERAYNFIDVCGWFASRCDLILLLFDPYKLDISDEFKAVIGTLKGHDDKVRVVLNKADQVDMQQLMRVYGALMWSLGKVFRTPEVCRVYIGSFNANVPIRSDLNPDGVKLFEKEQADLLQDLYEIPQRSCDRRVNEFVKRVRACKIHCLIIGHLRKQMPAMMGKQKAQEKLLAELPRHFAHVQREYHLPAGDFPDVNRVPGDPGRVRPERLPQAAGERHQGHG
eukprot:jgi/Botrbrau1/14660/Bobra.0108s0021.1